MAISTLTIATFSLRNLLQKLSSKSKSGPFLTIFMYKKLFSYHDHGVLTAKCCPWRDLHKPTHPSKWQQTFVLSTKTFVVSISILCIFYTTLVFFGVLEHIIKYQCVLLHTWASSYEFLLFCMLGQLLMYCCVVSCTFAKFCSFLCTFPYFCNRLF